MKKDALDKAVGCELQKTVLLLDEFIRYFERLSTVKGRKHGQEPRRAIKVTSLLKEADDDDSEYKKLWPEDKRSQFSMRNATKLETTQDDLNNHIHLTDTKNFIGKGSNITRWLQTSAGKHRSPKRSPDRHQRRVVLVQGMKKQILLRDAPGDLD